jgi:hypothetical protein
VEVSAVAATLETSAAAADISLLSDWFKLLASTFND